MKCPSFEEIYDMDIDNLLILKSNIEQNKINFNSIPLDEDDYDLYDYNTSNDKNSILELINSEIKERESTKDLLNFFTNLNFDTNNINTIESKFLQELNNNNNNKENKTNNIFQLQKNNNILEQKNIYTNGYLSNKNIFNKNSYNNNNYNLNQPVKITPNEGIKSLLNRTKIDPTQLQYTVSSNKYVDKYWSIDKERKNRKKNLNNKIMEISSNANNNTNFSSNASNNSHVSYKNLKNNIKSERNIGVISEKIIIGAIPAPLEKKFKKFKKKKKRNKKEDEVKKINTLELMRNYKVSDITQFLKKKTSLKPLNISTAINKNNINNKSKCNGNEFAPNIKLYNKTQNNKNFDKIISLNKNNENDIINENRDLNKDSKNNYIKEDNNLNNKEIIGEETENFVCIDHFYFQYENGVFKEIKYEINKYKELINKISKIGYSKSNKSVNKKNLHVIKLESSIFNEIKIKEINNSKINVNNNNNRNEINNIHNKKEKNIIESENIGIKNDNINKRNENKKDNNESNAISIGNFNNDNYKNKNLYQNNHKYYAEDKNINEEKADSNILKLSKDINTHIKNDKLNKDISHQVNEVNKIENLKKEEKNEINKDKENENIIPISDSKNNINTYIDEENKEEENGRI